MASTNLEYLQDVANRRTLGTVNSLFLQVSADFVSFYDEIDLGYDYLHSLQYGKESINYWKTRHRETRTYNLIYAQFTTLLGELIGSKMRFKFAADIGGTTEMSEVFSDLWTHSEFDNDWHSVFSRWLVSGFIKMGYIYPRFSDEKYPDGSFVVGNLHERDIMFDTTSRDPLLRDSEFWFRSQWYSKDKILIIVDEPDDRAKLEKLLTDRISMEQTSVEGFRNDIQDPQFVDINAGLYRVVEYHYFENIPATKYVDFATGESVILWDKREELKYLATHPMARPVGKSQFRQKRIKTYIPYAMYEISDVPNNLQDGCHDLIPFSAGLMMVQNVMDTFGIYRLLKPSQDAFNEFSNISEDLMRKTANPREVVKPDNIVNFQQYKASGDQPGFKIELDASVPTAKDALEQLYPEGNLSAEKERQSIASFMPMISGISPTMTAQNQGGAQQNNATLYNLQLQQSRRGLTMYYEAFRESFKFLLEKFVGIVQQNYTSQRMFTIFNKQPTGQNDRRVMINTMVGGQIVNDVSVGRYKVIIVDETTDFLSREARFMKKMMITQTLTQLYGTAGLNLQWLLSETDIPEINELIAYINNVQQAQGEADKKRATLDLAQKVQDMGLKQFDAQQPSEPQVSIGISDKL